MYQPFCGNKMTGDLGCSIVLLLGGDGLATSFFVRIVWQSAPLVKARPALFWLCIASLQK